MIYTSVDIGSHSIKIVVSERINDKFYTLASTSVRSKGIKKGIIKEPDLVLESLKEAILTINQDLGIEIKKVFLSFPLFLVNTSIETADIEVSGRFNYKAKKIFVVRGENISAIYDYHSKRGQNLLN